MQDREREENMGSTRSKMRLKRKARMMVRMRTGMIRGTNMLSITRRKELSDDIKVSSLAVSFHK